MSSRVVRFVNLNENADEDWLKTFILKNIRITGNILQIYVRQRTVDIADQTTLVFAYVVFELNQDAKLIATLLHGTKCENNNLDVALIGPFQIYSSFDEIIENIKAKKVNFNLAANHVYNFNRENLKPMPLGYRNIRPRSNEFRGIHSNQTRNVLVRTNTDRVQSETINVRRTKEIQLTQLPCNGSLNREVIPSRNKNTPDFTLNTIGKNENIRHSFKEFKAIHSNPPRNIVVGSNTDRVASDAKNVGLSRELRLTQRTSDTSTPIENKSKETGAVRKTDLIRSSSRTKGPCHADHTKNMLTLDGKHVVTPQYTVYSPKESNNDKLQNIIDGTKDISLTREPQCVSRFGTTLGEPKVAANLDNVKSTRSQFERPHVPQRPKESNTNRAQIIFHGTESNLSTEKPPLTSYVRNDWVHIVHNAKEVDNVEGIRSIRPGALAAKNVGPYPIRKKDKCTVM